MAPLDEQDQALLELLDLLAERGYQFATPTPDTIRMVRLRTLGRRAHDLRDVFGWSRAFRPRKMDPVIVDLMRRGGVVAGGAAVARSRVRVSSLDGRLFLHSAFPATARDAVFFGPDTYRFVRFLKAELEQAPPSGRIVDIGAGSGAGGIVAASLGSGCVVALADINPATLRLARVNAAHAGIEAEIVLSDGLAAVAGPISLAIANPPYLLGSSGRTYRDGGGDLGAEIALRWAREALERLEPGGRLLLYTGAVVIGGRDRFRAALEPMLAAANCAWRYDEIDPDVFGGMLAHPSYRRVERIAAVGVSIRKPG